MLRGAVPDNSRVVLATTARVEIMFRRILVFLYLPPLPIGPWLRDRGFNYCDIFQELQHPRYEEFSVLLHQYNSYHCDTNQHPKVTFFVKHAL